MGWGLVGTDTGCLHVSLSLFCGVQILPGKAVQREAQLHFLLCRNGSEVRTPRTVMVQLLWNMGNVWGWELAVVVMAGS